MTFLKYYKHYLSLHKNKICRRFHFAGQLVTLLFTLFVVLTGKWGYLLLSPFIIYPFAWTGHFFFEKNKPASFSNPLWAKACDWIMFKDILCGKIEL